MDLLSQALKKRILVLDGAMGTALQAKNLTASNFGGDAFEGCNEHLVLTAPHVVKDIHESYLKAGADVLETNTFGATPLVLNEYKLENKAYDINFESAKMCKTLAQTYSTLQQPRFVAGSMGPTTKAISVTGGVTFEELIQTYMLQALPLIEGGVDYLLLETAQDTRNLKAAYLGILKAFEKTSQRLPIAVSGTIEAFGAMLGGQTIEALWTSVEHMNPLYIGLNCATGPEFMTDPIRSLSKLASTHVACVPNAGLPDENGKYLETPAMMVRVLERFCKEGFINVLGGCCGTTAEHIRAFAELAQKYSPRKLPNNTQSALSGMDRLEITDDQRPLLVGERTNVIGSRKFKKLICDEDFDMSAEIARRQIKKGAQLIDICLANPDRNEFEDMKNFLSVSQKSIHVPWVIDSTDAHVMEMALTYSQGKPILNSINLEDGEERFEKVIPLYHQFGAMLVVGLIDDDPHQGMGISLKRKLEIAKRSYELLTQKYKVKPQDIIWDPLVFPCGTGDAQYLGSAVPTLDAIPNLKKLYPLTKTILGISNISFGLPDKGREVLNSVFLYHATQKGLDLAIVNSENLVRYSTLNPEEKKACEDLLWNTHPQAIESFAAFFRSRPVETKLKTKKLPVSERLSLAVIEGSKETLFEDLKLLLKTQAPLDIINGPLMKGMDEVGRLFNKNELIVAEVLQSAEVMKAAVNFLEPHMEKVQSRSRGKIILATVKGDVHDIGKNLVEIILSNNGFEVINLGIKVTPEVLIESVKTHAPHVIGLSGLLVKSCEQMVLTAEDFSKAGIQTPMLVGGAALSRGFVDRKIAKAYTGTVEYATDAMNGLELAKIFVDSEQFKTKQQEIQERQKKLQDQGVEPKNVSIRTLRSNTQDQPSPPPPDLDRHVLSFPLEQAWKFINPRMLYGRHLGLSNSAIDLFMEGNLSKLKDHEEGEKTLELFKHVERIKSFCQKEKLLDPKGVFQFFKAQSKGNTLTLMNAQNTVLGNWSFPRQTQEPYLNLSDYVSETNLDHVCLFVVTAGSGVRERAEHYKKEGEYLSMHILQALALETAEGAAEYLHKKIRDLWGIPDSGITTSKDLFQAKYTGKRYSFGYPACPDLKDQRLLFQLLKPENISVTLTEGDMMDPEASVSALVVAHPQAKYFSV